MHTRSVLQQHIKMQDVDSSNIQAVGHDPQSNTLSVQFRSGAIYHYPGVTAEQHQAFLGADSLGSHFHKHFRSREYVRV